MAFNPQSLPTEVYQEYQKGAFYWPLVVKKAVEKKIYDVDYLASVVFYLHHPERKGQSIAASEKAMIDQWKGFRTLIKPMVPAYSKPKPAEEPETPAFDWTVDEKIKEDFGREVFDWAKVPPKGVETKEFAPPEFMKRDYKAIFVWKSADPNTKCLANPKQRVQVLAMLRDDEAYWDKRTNGDRIGTEVLQAAQAAAVRDYRELIVFKKMCPQAAYLKLYAASQDLIYKMIIGLYGLMRSTGIPGAAPSSTAIARGIGRLLKEIRGGN